MEKIDGKNDEKKLTEKFTKNCRKELTKNSQKMTEKFTKIDGKN